MSTRKANPVVPLEAPVEDSVVKALPLGPPQPPKMIIVHRQEMGGKGKPSNIQHRNIVVRQNAEGYAKPNLPKPWDNFPYQNNFDVANPNTPSKKVTRPYAPAAYSPVNHPTVVISQHRRVPLAIQTRPGISPNSPAQGLGAQGTVAPRYFNPQGSAISTLGRTTNSEFAQLLGHGYQGDVIHHISSTTDKNGTVNHLIHTLDPQHAAIAVASHLGANVGREAFANVVPEEQRASHQISFRAKDGTSHNITFFRGRTPTPNPQGEILLKASSEPVIVARNDETCYKLLDNYIFKGLESEFSSPLFDAMRGGPFTSGSGSAWVHPDGSHELVRTHAGSISGMGKTMHQYQKATGKVRVGLDKAGAYAGFVDKVTPQQHRAVNEFLRAAMFRGLTPSYERLDPDLPTKFEYKEGSLPQRMIQKAWESDPTEDTILKAGPAHVDPMYHLPAGMKPGSPEHDAYLKSQHFDESSPHPEEKHGSFIYKDLEKAYKEIPGLREQFGLPQQNMWHSDNALMDMMQRGYGGKNWYPGYHEGLTNLANASGISPSRLLTHFALNGQSASLKQSAESTLKELSRHRAGMLKSPTRAQLLQDLGIRKASSDKPAELKTLLRIISGGGIDSTKLKAYGTSFIHPDSNPAVDKWIQRAMIGKESGGTPDTVANHVTIAATGRINHLRDLWNAKNPEDRISASQVQAMLWYGMKHSTGDHLDAVANHIEANHPGMEKHVNLLRKAAKDVRYDGDFSVTGNDFQLNHPQGIPLSKMHLLAAQHEPALEQLVKDGMIHVDNHNWHNLAPGTTEEQLTQGLAHLVGHHSKYQDVKVRRSADGSPTHISIPKRSVDAVGTLLAQKGVEFNPKRAKDVSQSGTASVWLHPGVGDYLNEHEGLKEGLATMHATRKYHEAPATKHKLSVVIGDIGHGTKALAAKAFDLFPKGQKPEPIKEPFIYGAYSGHPDYNDAPAPNPSGSPVPKVV